MSRASLPERASLDYLRKLAKERLADLRRSDPSAKLAAALLALAREHGFSSWRALKAEVERRRGERLVLFFAACAAGDAGAVAAALDAEPDLVQAADPDRRHGGWSALHTAAERRQSNIASFLVAHGAEVNAREAGDNTTPLHWAAAKGDLETARLLLDTGADVHGEGDAHELGVIGWATYFAQPGSDAREMSNLLLAHGARHHIFSALSLADCDLVRALVEETPDALDRRMSRFEEARSPLHFAIARGRLDLLVLLLELGADVEAKDASGRTPLAIAMLKGDVEAANYLSAAGAITPQIATEGQSRQDLRALAGATRKLVPMISVANVKQGLDWYCSIGFSELGRHGEGGALDWAMLGFGDVELMLRLGVLGQARTTSLWFYTDKISELYEAFKARQLGPIHAALAGDTDAQVSFEEDLYEPFYGGRQFSIRDPDGNVLVFLAP